MDDFELKLTEEIKRKVEYYNDDFSLANFTHGEAHKKVYEFLKTIVEYAGTNDYIFVISATRLEEKHGKYMLPYLYEILDNYVNYPTKFNIDIAFAAYNSIALHYVRVFQPEALHDFIVKTDYFKIFRPKYPLALGILRRYTERAEMFDKMLLLDQATLRIMDKMKTNIPAESRTTKYGYVQTFDNVAIKIGIVVATVSIFEKLYIRGILDKDIDLTKYKVNHYKRIEDMSDEELIKFSELSENYELDYSLANQENLNIAIRYCDEAIEFNPKYPKYYYLKAQLIFYGCLYNKEEIDFNKLTNIKQLLKTAEDKESRDASDFKFRFSRYENFEKTVLNYVDHGHKINISDLELMEQKDEIVKLKECPDATKRPVPNVVADENYAFISYSTRDFKPVYCDLLSFRKRGLTFWYDAKVIPGERWQVEIENRIKNATCIICYLSENFLLSKATYKELMLFKKYKKEVIWVDLTGKKQISQIILDVLRHGDDEHAEAISSDMLNIVTSLINDDVSTIVRNFDPKAELHIDRIEETVSKKYSSILKNLNSESLTIRNNKVNENGKKFKPNEDYMIEDKKNNVFIVMDGISRKNEEYKNNKSLAYDVAKIFADSMHSYIVKNLEHCKTFGFAKSMLEKGFKDSNKLVEDYLEQHKKQFEGYEIPGAVGIAAFILNGVLYYGSIGDCMGILLRADQKIIFAQKQTTFAFDILKVEQDRNYLYKEVVNKRNNKYGYGVVNGDKAASNYFDVSSIDINKDDQIFFVSDGVSDFIQYTKAKDLRNLSLKQIISLSNKQDELMNKPYFDDKTIIRLK